MLLIQPDRFFIFGYDLQFQLQETRLLCAGDALLRQCIPNAKPIVGLQNADSKFSPMQHLTPIPNERHAGGTNQHSIHECADLNVRRAASGSVQPLFHLHWIMLCLVHSGQKIVCFSTHL